jgi:hypothetical protein
MITSSRSPSRSPSPSPSRSPSPIPTPATITPSDSTKRKQDGVSTETPVFKVQKQNPERYGASTLPEFLHAFPIAPPTGPRPSTQSFSSSNEALRGAFGFTGQSILSKSTATAGPVTAHPPLTYQHLENVRMKEGLRDMVALADALGYNMTKSTTTARGRNHSLIQQWKRGEIPTTVVDRIESKFGKNSIDWGLSVSRTPTVASTATPTVPPTAVNNRAVKDMKLPELYDIMINKAGKATPDHLERIRELTEHSKRSFSMNVIQTDPAQVGLKLRRGGDLNDNWRDNIATYLEENHNEEINRMSPSPSPASSVSTPE